jgi:hypothetical protein
MFRCNHHHQGTHYMSLLKLQLLKESINLSKSSGFFTYHQAQHSKILHGARFALSGL